MTSNTLFLSLYICIYIYIYTHTPLSLPLPLSLSLSFMRFSGEDRTRTSLLNPAAVVLEAPQGAQHGWSVTPDIFEADTLLIKTLLS